MTSRLLGCTVDDAAGEAFDKVASILNLGFPGGPVVIKLSRTADPGAIAFPRTMLDPDSLDFSFSGLKTAVLYHVHGPGKTSGELDRLTQSSIAGHCASFPRRVVDVLVERRCLPHRGLRRGRLGGGHSMLRKRLVERC